MLRVIGKRSRRAVSLSDAVAVRSPPPSAVAPSDCITISFVPSVDPALKVRRLADRRAGCALRLVPLRLVPMRGCGAETGEHGSNAPSGSRTQSLSVAKQVPLGWPTHGLRSLLAKAPASVADGRSIRWLTDESLLSTSRRKLAPHSVCLTRREASPSWSIGRAWPWWH